jgi:maltodextrin utilization protein YvdJ
MTAAVVATVAIAVVATTVVMVVTAMVATATAATDRSAITTTKTSLNLLNSLHHRPATTTAIWLFNQDPIDIFSLQPIHHTDGLLFYYHS